MSNHKDLTTFLVILSLSFSCLMFLWIQQKFEELPDKISKHMTMTAPKMIQNAIPISTSTPQIPNPASQYCIKQGGTLQTEKRPEGEYNLCYFEDNMACEEWALYRGQCPVGGVKTTGYDTIDQKYCAWLGGKTLAVPNAQCTLPDGKICPDKKLYNGTCPKK